MSRRSSRSTARFRFELLEPRSLLSGVPTTFGAVGDSLTDGSNYTTSWVPTMYLGRGADFGGPGTPFNVAIGGSTTASIFSSGQVTAMQNLVATGQVDLPYLFIGGNDLLAVDPQIASGALTGAALTSTINTWVTNIRTATDTIRTAFPAGADKDFVLVSFPDTTSVPARASTYDTQVKIDRGHAAINQANAALYAMADARGIPVVDLTGLQIATGGGSLVVGGVTINTTGAADPHYFFRDVIHPGAVGHSIIANMLMTASNVAYGTTFAPFSDQEVVQAGLSGEYTGETFSPLVDYTDFIHYQPSTPATIEAHHLFYKGSTAWDVTNANLPRFSHDNAIAPDKSAYLPGVAASSFVNVSSYTQGINGVMVDIAGAHGTIMANDFSFKIGNNNSPASWPAAPAPTQVTVRAGAGEGGSDRVELLWANGEIQKTWLQITLKGYDVLGGANVNTGLDASDVFYFGSALADSGAGDTQAYAVNTTDELSARNDPHGLGNPATIINANDFNRDGFVNSADQFATRNFSTSLSNWLKFLQVGAGGPFAPTVLPAVVDGNSVATALATSAPRPAAASAGDAAGGNPIDRAGLPDSAATTTRPAAPVLWEAASGGLDEPGATVDDELLDLLLAG